MPNYVRNKVVLPKEVADKYIEGVEFDFDKVVPQPKEIKDYLFGAPLTDKSVIEKTAGEYLEKVNGNKDLPDEEMIKVLKEMELESDYKEVDLTHVESDNIYKNFNTSEMRDVFCYLKTGYQDWYEFNINNWGVKWNAFNTEIYTSFEKDLVEITFDTAWSTPEPIFDEIQRQNPHIDFDVRFYDEDLGHNCGILSYSDGMKQFYNFDINATNSDMTGILFTQGFNLDELERYADDRFGRLEYEDNMAKPLADTLKTEFIDMKDFAENKKLPLTEEIINLKELVKTPIEEIEQIIEKSYEYFNKNSIDKIKGVNKIKDIDLMN